MPDQETAPPEPSQYQRSRGVSRNYDRQKPPSERAGRMPTAVGIMIAGFVLLVSAGGTVFFLTKPAENQRLVEEGQHQLQLGQYAFALKTLTQAVQMKPDDPKALLSLARAYVGVDQIDKAWDCIQRAQQLGAGVVAEPQLASDLAGYYRQHGQNEKAIELLRPLAASNVPGKKGELSDLDAAWGDQALQDGNIQQAMHCWEEVKETGEGMRVAEADSRLATIYSKAAEDLLRKGQNDEALKYYAKLNIMAPTAVSYQRTAEIYEKEHKLELAIDQMRKAVQIAPEPALANQKLASLMAARGKELLDSGDSNAGYGYLQQAQGIDPHVAAPSATIRNVHLGIEDGSPHFTADVWNPGPASVNSLTVKTELFDTAGGRSLWSKDFRIIDDFVPPLAAKDSRPLDVVATATIADPGSTEMRVYINGTLYNSYPFAKSASGSHAGDHGTGQPILRPRITPTTADTMPPVAPSKVKEQDTAPPIAPDASTKEPTATAGESPEEKTLKDLQ